MVVMVSFSDEDTSFGLFKVTQLTNGMANLTCWI